MTWFSNSPSAHRPLSDRDLAWQCFNALQEMKRACEQHSMPRAEYHRDRMNETLDVLCERLRLRSTAWPA